MTVPNTLEWNYEIIMQLVIDGYYETDTFDFKPALTSRNIMKHYCDVFAHLPMVVS